MFAVLDRKYFGELLLNALFTFVVITTIALLGIAPVAFFRVPGLGIVLYLSLVRYLLVQALSYLLPLTMLIAVVFVYGRAAADHEITTLKASGIHPYRILLPGLLLAVVVGLICFEVEATWGPRALHQLRALPASQETIQPQIERAIAENRKSFTFDNRDGAGTVSWFSAEVPSTGGAILRGVLFEKETKRPPPRADPVVRDGIAKAAALLDDERTMIAAQEARVSFDTRHHEVRITMKHAKGLSGKLRDYEQEEFELVVSLAPAMDRSRLKFQTIDELFALRERGRASIDVGGEHQPLLRAYRLDDIEGRIQERFARAASPLAFLLLGFPLALVFKSGNRMVAFLLATLIGLFIYYPTDRLADTLLDQHLVGPLVACWTGNALISGIGLLLLGFVVRR